MEATIRQFPFRQVASRRSWVQRPPRSAPASKTGLEVFLGMGGRLSGLGGGAWRRGRGASGSYLEDRDEGEKRYRAVGRFLCSYKKHSGRLSERESLVNV